MTFDSATSVFHNFFDGQGTVFCRMADVNPQTRILCIYSIDLFLKYGFFRMANLIVEVYIMSQVAVHIAEKRKERCNTDSTRDPDLLWTTCFVIEHPIRSIDNRVCTSVQFGK